MNPNKTAKVTSTAVELATRIVSKLKSDEVPMILSGSELSPSSIRAMVSAAIAENLKGVRQ